MSLKIFKSPVSRYAWFSSIAIAALLLAFAVFLSLMFGGEHIDMRAALYGTGKDHAMLFSVRMPRVIAAALIGIALSSSGCAFQAMLRNPLADPYVLGVSGGAALGGVIGLVLHMAYASPVFSFAGAVLSSLAILGLSGKRRGFSPFEMLLTGVIFNAFCFAFILFLNAVVTMQEAYQIMFLLIGNLESPSVLNLGFLAVFTSIGFFVLIFMSKRMNVLLIGDDEAYGLGVNLSKLRFVVFAAASLMVGASVSVAGLVGFVGLFIPHMVKFVVGGDHRILIPLSGFVGGIFLIAADAIARTVLIHTQYATQLPVGVITAIVGAPVFILILKKRRWHGGGV